jgi:hypothetical protein
MKKYQTEFKLKVVKSFLAGDGRAKPLAGHDIRRMQDLLGHAEQAPS